MAERRSVRLVVNTEEFDLLKNILALMCLASEPAFQESGKPMRPNSIRKLKGKWEAAWDDATILPDEEA